MGTAIKSFTQNTDLVETATGRWSWFYTLSGTAALLAGALFLATAAGFVVSRLAPDILAGQVWPFGSNWLIVLFELHARFRGSRGEPIAGAQSSGHSEPGSGGRNSSWPTTPLSGKAVSSGP